MFEYRKLQLELEKVNLKILEAKHQKLLDAQSIKVGLAKKALQEVCSHDHIMETDASDYHNNIEWTAQHCVDCGKYLGKY